MPECSVCHEVKPKVFFAKTPNNNIPEKRKCRSCAAAGPAEDEQNHVTTGDSLLNMSSSSISNIIDKEDAEKEEAIDIKVESKVEESKAEEIADAEDKMKAADAKEKKQTLARSTSTQIKECNACTDKLAKTAFSKKQWSLKSRRRCKECIESGREVGSSISSEEVKKIDTAEAKKETEVDTAEVKEGTEVDTAEVKEGTVVNTVAVEEEMGVDTGAVEEEMGTDTAEEKQKTEIDTAEVKEETEVDIVDENEADGGKVEQELDAEKLESDDKAEEETKEKGEETGGNVEAEGGKKADADGNVEAEEGKQADADGNVEVKEQDVEAKTDEIVEVEPDSNAETETDKDTDVDQKVETSLDNQGGEVSESEVDNSAKSEMDINVEIKEDETTENEGMEGNSEGAEDEQPYEGMVEADCKSDIESSDAIDADMEEGKENVSNEAQPGTKTHVEVAEACSKEETEDNVETVAEEGTAEICAEETIEAENTSEPEKGSTEEVAIEVISESANGATENKLTSFEEEQGNVDDETDEKITEENVEQHAINDNISNQPEEVSNCESNINADNAQPNDEHDDKAAIKTITEVTDVKMETPIEEGSKSLSRTVQEAEGASQVVPSTTEQPSKSAIDENKTEIKKEDEAKIDTGKGVETIAGNNENEKMNCDVIPITTAPVDAAIIDKVSPQVVAAPQASSPNGSSKKVDEKGHEQALEEGLKQLNVASAPKGVSSPLDKGVKSAESINKSVSSIPYTKSKKAAGEPVESSCNCTVS